jgi:NAD-dependent DNA ligase
MNPTPEIKKRVEKLRETIRRHDRLYYDRAAPGS